MNTFIRLLYAILIAAAVVAFVGVTIYTFYPAPTAPTYDMQPIVDSPKVMPTPNPDDYQRRYDAYQAALKTYQRNVSIILAAVTPIIVVGGLWLQRKLDIIGEGVSLGGVGTSIYAVTMASMADHRIMRFIAVTLFLASVVAIVYFKFSEFMPAKKPARKRA